MSHGHFYAISPVIHKSLILWESRLQHKCTWWLQVLWKFWIFWNFWNFKILSKFWNFELSNFLFFFYFRIFKFLENFKILWNFMKTEIFEILKFFENFRVFLNRRWSPSVPNKYKTNIQSGRGTKNPRKRLTLPVHSF